MIAPAALAGGFATPAFDSARAFRTVLTAMSRPGTILTLSASTAPQPMSAAAATVALVLLDPTTPVYLAPGHDDDALRQWLAFHTGAPPCAPQDAAFAFGTWASLSPITRFAPGTPEYPDRSTTLVIEVSHLAAEGPRLTGPGIQGEARLTLPDPAAISANTRLFPLGCDLILTCGDRIACLPRSTKVETN